MPTAAEPGGLLEGGGGGGGGPATSSSSTRSRPCDTCRLRKTRCVREEGQYRCVLCTFHNQPCTFLRGPTPRQRRLNKERDRASPSSSRQGETATTPASVENNNPGSAQSPQQSGTKVKSVEAPRPKILSNTLGLDLKTHAEYIGPTDYRDPFLLDLHRPNIQLNEDGSAPTTLATYSRRLDHRTVFLVHPDESTASESRRIADLDAIEATVQPLGRTLVDLYFRIVHPSFPILHKDVFISKHRLSHRHFAPSLLAAVYLVALDWQLYDSSLAGREIESIPDPAALEELAERTMAQDMRRPKLSTLEAGLLLLQRNRRIVDSGAHTHPTSSRMFTAQLVAMAQDLGIHLDCSSWSIPEWEIGLRRRLAWALFMQDRWGACVHGRPFLIQDSEWDVQPCTASDYPELVINEDGNPDINSTISIGWDLFLRHIELTHILSDVIRTFYSAAATRTGGTLDQMGVVAAVELAKPLVFRLREWHASLPPQLHLMSTKIRELCANGALHLAHASIEIALHRALIRILTPDTPSNLYDLLRSTARTKVQSAIELLGSLRPEHTAAFWGSAAAYQAAEVGSLAGLLWATADSFEEMAWCAARIEELRWALRVRGAATPFAREALRLLERDIGGLGMVNSNPELMT
ncbi:fungal-specific transcription factor domain-containing protein [Mariannaea sp. PMI_226]|nr:fungal-specific transcription factor domain-containing protein [Mariannaea sp. PMI_226]